MKHIIRLSFILLVSCTAFGMLRAQNGYLNAYDLGLPKLIFTNMVVHNDTIVVNGIIGRGDTFTVQNFILMRMDTTGTVIDYSIFQDSMLRDYGMPSFGSRLGLLRCRDNSGYISMIYTSTEGFALVKIGNAGDMQWKKVYHIRPAVYQNYTDIVETGSGYLIPGKIKLDNFRNIYTVIVKTDFSGNTIWEQQYGEESGLNNHNSAILIIDENEVVISGSASIPDAPVEQRRFEIFLLAIDSTGRLKWQWKSEPTLDETARGLCRDDDGNWAYMTIHVEYAANGSFTGLPKFVKRDSDFNLLVETELDDADAFLNFALDMLPLSDGGYLAVGINAEIDPSIQSHGYAWMVKLDKNGEVVWERKDLTFPDIGQSSIQYLSTAAELPGGSIVAAGHYRSGGSHYAGILIKVDKDGCIDTLCTTTSLMDQIARKEIPVRVYPNPATDHMIMELHDGIQDATAMLYDMSGRMVYQSAVQSGVNVIRRDRNRIHAGMYVWQVLDREGRQRASGKVIFK